jgi:hypothetical protein
MHPLSSADDHAYVINDAGITTLIIDPYFVERALALLEKCRGLTQVLTNGPTPATSRRYDQHQNQSPSHHRPHRKQAAERSELRQQSGRDPRDRRGARRRGRCGVRPASSQAEAPLTQSARQCGSRPMNAISRVCTSASAGTSTRWP